MSGASYALPKKKQNLLIVITGKEIIKWFRGRNGTEKQGFQDPHIGHEIHAKIKYTDSECVADGFDWWMPFDVIHFLSGKIAGLSTWQKKQEGDCH